jgi:hypothetical protein
VLRDVARALAADKRQTAVELSHRAMVFQNPANAHS